MNKDTSKDRTDEELLSAAERAAMLSDIARTALAAGTKLFPEHRLCDLDVAAGQVAGHNSPIERLGFIEHALPSLIKTLHQIGRSPLTAAALESRRVLPCRARRVTAASWMTSARRGQAQRTVEENHRVLRHDTPENRAVKSFLLLLTDDCRTITRLAYTEAEHEAAERADRCARHLSRLLCEPWWEEVSAKHGDWTQAPTQRETLRPDYASLTLVRRHFRNSFCFDWNSPQFMLPPRDTWRLYETWCFFCVLQALGELGWQTVSAHGIITLQNGRLAVTLSPGVPGRIVLQDAYGRKLSLIYHQTFAEGRGSMSHAMQPDIALSSGQSLWILDAKYKAYAEPGDEGTDINQMHAYRDGIVGTQGTRPVISAWCLYVGRAQCPNRSMIAYGRGGEAPVGALCLRPANAEAVRSLRCFLEEQLSTGAFPPVLPLSPET